MVIQGRMRKRGLSTTSESFFSRSWGIQPMKQSPGRELAGGGGEADHGDGAVVDGVAHLGTYEGLVAEVVVAGAINSFQRLPSRVVADDGMEAEGENFVEGCGRWEERWFGVGSEDHMAAGRSAGRCAWPAW